MELTNAAPSEEVKAIIRTYDVDKNGDDIYKLMNTSVKPPLADTAEYLQINSNQLKKDTLIRNIISKINSLLLEYCNKCSQYFAATLGAQPIAVCECGQPCHEPCYAEIKDIFTNYPGVVYQCSTCLKTPTQNETTKPTDENVAKKGKT